MTRRLLLAPAVVGVIATTAVARRGIWLAWPVLAYGVRAVCRRQPRPETELDYFA